MPNSEKRYIATQGCLKATVAAFWQMVWENKATTIVMTTNVVERGKNKCTPYWATGDAAVIHGKFAIEAISEQIHPDYTHRVMSVALVGRCSAFDRCAIAL